MTRRTPTQYDWEKVEFDETILSQIPGYPRRESSRAGHKIEAIVVHHMAMVGRGDGSAADACVRAWRTREASAHYAVDGVYVRQLVWDNMAAWSVGNLTWNQKTISIEHANSTGKPTWKVSDDTFSTGARLVAHLHEVYKLGRPVSGKTLRQHDEFMSTACPGPYLGGSEWSDYVAEAQRIYDQITQKEPIVVPIYKIDLSNWKITLPVGSKGKPDEFYPAKFVKPWFRKHKNGAISFRCNAGGVTTGRSKYPRSELREMAAGGQKASWSNTSRVHRLRTRFGIHAFPEGKSELVVAQIHDADDDVLMIRAEQIDAKRYDLYAEWSNGKGKGSELEHIGTFKMRKKVRVVISTAKGLIQVFVNSEEKSKQRKAISGAYFKAGCYLQANTSTDNAAAYGEVRFYDIRIEHK